MGLDMYLNAEKYISKYDNEVLYKDLNEIGFPMEVTGVKCRAMYWRKSNQIHQWFVKNVQQDVDDCDDYPVSRETLQKLIDVCKEVLKNRKLCHELLPSSEGFFFGSTEYDEYYFEDIIRTAHELEIVLAKTSEDAGKFCEWEFTYRSSW